MKKTILCDWFSLEDEFWLTIEELGECWIWVAGLTHGYGKFKGKIAHRVAYELTYGPTTQKILHTCDIPPCVNPAHLYAGTQYQNMQDKQARAKLDFNRKLSDNQQEYVRRFYLNPFSAVKLAKLFEVNPRTITQIVRRGKLDVNASTDLS